MSLRRVAALRARTMETEMRALLKALWGDESGLVLTAEAVAVGTLGVVGAAVGAGAVAKSVNAELEETAFALRSLDQSFSIPGQRIGKAYVAGSSYRQKSVEEAHRELREQIRRDRAAEERARKEDQDKEAPDSAARDDRPSPPKKKRKRERNADETAEVQPAAQASEVDSQ